MPRKAAIQRRFPMRFRPASLAVPALALLTIAFFPRESRAYPTVEGQPARYVIITGDALAASFQPLADWKTQTGLPAVVRRMSDVIAAHPIAFDDAERVRLEIRDAWQAGAQWVLLGGGIGVVPHRYAHSTFFGGKDLLTDLYFQCLDGNWDADGDHVYGEGFLDAGNPGDNADLVPEVWLGRAPVLTPAEADRFVAKTLQYERTPAGDYEHLSLECAEVLFPQDWDPTLPPTLDGAELVEPLLSSFDLHPALQVTRLYENFQDPRWRPGALRENRASVLDALNLGSNQTLIVGRGFIHNLSVGSGTLDESDFLGLTNGSRLQSLRILGSTAAQFDSGGIGVAALLAPAGGAASVVGGSDLEFPTSARFMANEYYRLIYQDGVNAQGEATARSPVLLLPFTSFDSVNRWSVMTQLLLGDPELRTWTGPLRTLTVSHTNKAFVIDTGFDVIVRVGSAPIEGARVAAWSAGQFLGVAITDAAGAARVPIDPTGHGSFRLTVTANDARPFEESVRVVGSPRMRRPVAQAPGAGGVGYIDYEGIEGQEEIEIPPRGIRGGALAGEASAPSRASLEASIPARLALRVRGPQPVAGALELELSLRSAAPARLDVMDLAGRSLASRDLAGVGPGTVTLRLDSATPLAPGLYWLRLTQNGERVHARAVVLR